MTDKECFRRVLLVVAAIVPLITTGFWHNPVFAQEQKEAWSTESLMRMLSQVKEADLTFTEERSSAFLVGDIVLKGSLKYIAPDFIEKRVESPYKHRTKISGDTLLVEKISARGESSIQQYSLSSSEALSTIVEGFRATLAGDLMALLEHYNIVLEGDVLEWLVTFTPKKPKLLDHVEKIALTGAEREIRTIETTNADGDVARLSLFYQMIK